MKEGYLNDLNPKQKEACEATEGPSLIIAGAGSGKTRVLTYRVAYLINDCLVHPSSILAITFTNKAAKEMRDRLESLIGDQAKWVTAMTFHSFCAYILRREINIIKGRSRTFQIIDDDETETMIKNAMAEINIDSKLLKPSIVANAISAIKSRMVSLEYYDKHYDDRIRKIMDQYNADLIKNNLLDFDDLILLTMEIFENHPEVLERYQNIYRYILVDEFQDTSNIQYDLVKLIGWKNKNVFIVGDEDQSIYSFRGANINNIRKFMKDFPGFHKYVLDQNYRSTVNILDCANSLIKHNEDRIPKDLWTVNQKGEDVRLLAAYSDKAEAREVASEIERLVEYKGYKYEDIAILYRNNAISRNFENEFISDKIPYQIYSGLSFYKRKEVKDIIAYLRLIINPDDFFSFKRVINSPKRGVGDTSISRIQTMVDYEHLSIWDSALKADVNKTVKDTINTFFGMIVSLREDIAKMPLFTFLNSVYEKTGYIAYIKSLDADEGFTRDENIKELFTAISEIQSLGSVSETIQSYIDSVTLMTDLDIESKDPNHVSMMTMHTAKGLEFKVVFAVALEQGLIPGYRAVSSKEIEEERRIFYVAITRAEERLYLTYATSRFSMGTTTACLPSPFLADIALNAGVQRNLEPKKVFPSSSDSFMPHKNSNEVTYPKGEYNIGDRVEHAINGKGTIMAEVQGFYIIQFDGITNAKKVIVNHPMLKKIDK